MRWIALALLVSLAAAIWWFDSPWPTRSAHWDQRYAEAASRADCEEQLALIRVGVEADYPPAASALGDLAERNACGYLAGQFDYQEEDYAGRAVQRNQIESLLSGYAQSNQSLRRDLNNGWFLRGRLMTVLATTSGRPANGPHSVLRRLASQCADHLLESSYATHWAALESSLQDEHPDPHHTANAIFQQQLACRESIYQASVALRAGTSWSLRERGRYLLTEALYLWHPQAIAECMDFVPPSQTAYDDPEFEPRLYCPFDGGQNIRNWAGRGDVGARTRWLDTVDTSLWADGSFSAYGTSSPLWVAIHATIAGHPIRETSLSYLTADCVDVVDETALRIQRLQDARAPSSGPVVDETIRAVWRCEPEAIRASFSFENYYPNEAFPPYHERWTSAFDPDDPDLINAG